MKHNIPVKALCLAAAAVMSWSAVCGAGIPRASAQTSPPAAADVPAQQSDSSEPVTVIVKIAGDALMAQPEALGQGAGFLETERAAELTAQYEKQQQAVQERIRQFYPALQVGFSYSALYNGFSCKLPANLIERVRALPDVVSVTETADIAVPQMNRAAAFSGFPAFHAETGCSGEGQVIAVIDSELDVTHPMFKPLADDIETAVSKEDIEKVISSGTLNVKADADRSYISSKLPYVMNYANPDNPYEGISNPYEYHGTHVSGIAAGNTFTDSDGTTLSGIAKDAQLMFFGVCANGGHINADAGLAAIEDAVKLHADVINMSWGADAIEYWGENPVSEAVAAADRAGVIICNSAGNADNGAYSWGIVTIPENPDTGMICDKAELGSPILLVASANNVGPAEFGVISHEDRKMVLIPMINSNGSTYFLSDVLQPGDYSYADCGNGSQAEFDEIGDLQDRIALVQRTSFKTADIAERAIQKNAAGLLLIDKEKPDGMDYIYSESGIWVSGVSYEDGQVLRNAEKKYISVSGEKALRDVKERVSSYTAWGVKQSLDLRPDIMGIGGSVRSAAYDGGTMTASGTSMSSPYVAGCTAVLREYLEKQDIRLSGAEFASYLRRLMMNTAVPYQENGVFVTPRRQGAGLVALDKALNAKVLMSGETGDAKINLFDKLGDSFSFHVTLTNSGSEDVTFKQADVCLTTDGTYYDNELNCDRTGGQQKLKCTTDFSGPVTVAAGESRTVKISVTLDAAQCRDLEKLFKYGFFTEGYVLLSGAENSADISIPLLGYHGDWAQLPIFDPEMDSVLIQLGVNTDAVPSSLIQKGLIYKQILAHAPIDELKKIDEKTGFFLAETYGTEEEKAQLNAIPEECWISPNKDSIADCITGTYFYSCRRGTYKSLHELDAADGTVLYQQKYGEAFDIPFDVLEEGDYKYTTKRWIAYPGSEEHPQVFSETVHIDRQAPKVTHKITAEKGRTYLEITASDNGKLQGLAVVGSGAGGQAGVYQPGGKQQLIEQVNFANILFAYSNGSGTVLTGKEYENIGTLPYVLRKYSDIAKREEGQYYNFADVLAPEPDQKGVWNVKYDITDLKNYSFTVLDEAYNFVEIRSDDNAAEELVRKTGCWVDEKNGIYVIGEKNTTFTSFWDGSETTYTYTAKGSDLTLVSGSETKHCSVRAYADTNYQLEDTDSKTYAELVSSKILQMQYEGRKFIPANQLIEAAKKEGAKTQNTPLPALKDAGIVRGELSFLLEYETESGLQLSERYDVSIFNGQGTAFLYRQRDEKGNTDVEHRNVELLQQYLTEIPAGLYYINHSDALLLFNKDGKTGTIVNPGTTAELGFNDTPFTYTLDENGNFTMEYLNKTQHGSVTRDLTTGKPVISFAPNSVLYKWELELITDDSEKLAALRPTDEICDLATAYINAYSGLSLPQEQRMDYNPDNGKYIYKRRYTGDYYYTFVLTIDPFTLDVTDQNGNQGNLLQPPKLPQNAAFTLRELCDKAAEACGRDETNAMDAIPILRSDGQVLVIVQTIQSDLIAQYLADPVTGSLTPVLSKCGDVNCDGSVDVSDAVLLARLLAEDRTAVISAEGKANADCDHNLTLTHDDVFSLLQAIVKLITL